MARSYERNERLAERFVYERECEGEMNGDKWIDRQAHKKLVYVCVCLCVYDRNGERVCVCVSFS